MKLFFLSVPRQGGKLVGSDMKPWKAFDRYITWDVLTPTPISCLCVRHAMFEITGVQGIVIILTAGNSST